MNIRKTLSGLKAFIRKNKDNLYVKQTSDFNGMTDSVETCENATFVKVQPNEIDFNSKNTLGINGLWLVGNSRDSITFNEESNTYRVYNSCGSCELLAK